MHLSEWEMRELGTAKYVTDYSLQGDSGARLQIIDLLVQFHEKQIFDEVSILCSAEDIKVKGKNTWYLFFE